MKLFREAIIQEKIRNLFSASIESGRLAHAYIFYGAPGSGKEAFALELAKAVNCENDNEIPCGICPNCKRIAQFSHPDLKFIFPRPKEFDEKKISQYYKVRSANPYRDVAIEGHLNIAIDAIRDLKNEAKYAPYEAKKRFFIISGAETFSKETANSFLKLLEEPPETLIIILITDQYHLLLETIKSRCQPVFFPTLNDEQINAILKRYDAKLDISRDDYQMIRALAKNNIKKIFEYLSSDYTNWLSWAYNYLKAVTSFNIIEINSLVEQLSSSKNRAVYGEIIDLLIIWMVDAMHYRISGEKTVFTLHNYAENIKKFTGFAPGLDYDSCIRLLENTRNDITRNAQVLLQFLSLAIKLNEIISQARLLTEEAA